jgi:hypothetical protein
MGNDKSYDRHINIWINGKEVKNDVASIQKEWFKLNQELKKTTVGSKEYYDKIAEMKKLDKIIANHRVEVKGTGDSWSKLKGLFSSAQGMLVAGIAAITAGYQSLKTVIFSTDALGDQFEKTLGGWKGGLDAVARAIATMDFKNFGKNIRAAIDEGRRYAESLDQIDEKTRSLKIAEAEGRNELFKQREIQNDVRKSLTERNKAGLEAIKIEEDLALIRTQIGEQGFKNEAENISVITKLTEEEVLAYAKQEKEMVANIEKGKEYNQMVSDRNSLEAKSRAASQRGTSLKQEEIDEWGRLTDEIKAASSETIRYAFAAANMPGDEKMQLFVDKYVAWQEAIGSARENTLRVRAKQANTEKQLDEEQLKSLTDVVATALQDPSYNADEYIKAESEKLLRAEQELNTQRVESAQDAEKEKVEALAKSGEAAKALAEKDWAEMLATDRKNLEEKIDAYMTFGAMIGDIVGSAMADGTMTAREAAKQIIGIALDELGNFATLAIAKATIGSLTTADSIATFGISGGIRAAVLTGLIKAAVGAVKGVVNKNLWTGGYSGSGGKYEPKGVVHGGEWVANADMVASPVTGPIIQALEQARVNGMPGYANGGGPGMSTSGPTKSAPVIVAMDPELKNLIRENIRINKMLIKDGVSMKFGYQEADNVRKGINRLEDIESDVSMG